MPTRNLRHTRRRITLSDFGLIGILVTGSIAAGADMALAKSHVKDNHIPPFGFNNAANADGHAPGAGTHNAAVQHWDDSYFVIPDSAVNARVEIYSQNLPHHCIAALRHENHTDDCGDILYDLWVTTGKGLPLQIGLETAALDLFTSGDLDCDEVVGHDDLMILLNVWRNHDEPQDLDGDRHVNVPDLLFIFKSWTR